MTISGTSGVSGGAPAGGAGMPQASDPVSKNIQDQISRLQKQLQELSSNTEMTAEAKMKKRQELQKQISDLNMQLRQHQIDQRREKQKEKTSFDDMLGTDSQQNQKKGKENAAVPSQASMEAMISADTARSQAKVQGSVSTKMENRAGILESEIALDQSRGIDTKRKEEELADTEQKAMEAAAAQMGTLAEANKTLEEAAKNEQTDKSEEEKDEEKKVGENAQTAEGAEGAQAGNVGLLDAAKTGSVSLPDSDEQHKDALEGVTPQIAPVVHYTPVDVRL